MTSLNSHDIIIIYLFIYFLMAHQKELWRMNI